MIRSIFYIFILLFIVPGRTVGQDYIVGENDVLKVTVYGHDDLTTTVRVSGDKTINLPLLDSIEVAGLTCNQISEKVAELLANNIIVNPQVNVFVQEFRSRKVVILGQVKKPGLYELQGKSTFLELLSEAGGLTEEAGEKTIIKRKNSSNGLEEQNFLTIDMIRLIETGDNSQNVEILDGDNIYIAKAGMFYVSGEVNKPDAYKLEEEMTLIKAITKAGGFSVNASKSSVRIIRKLNGSEQILEKTSMNERILPEDVILVPESIF